MLKFFDSFAYSSVPLACEIVAPSRRLIRPFGPYLKRLFSTIRHVAPGHCVRKKPPVVACFAAPNVLPKENVEASAIAVVREAQSCLCACVEKTLRAWPLRASRRERTEKMRSGIRFPMLFGIKHCEKCHRRAVMGHRLGTLVAINSPAYVASALNVEKTPPRTPRRRHTPLREHWPT